MKRNTFKTAFSSLVVAGLFIGMFKGREVKERWIAIMKGKQERASQQTNEVKLDEFEISAYHS